MANGFDIPADIAEAPARTVTRVTWRRVVLRDAALIFAVACLVELALRITAPHYANNLYDQQYTGSQPLALNAKGYRGPVATAEKATGELRIVALGDSVTFGTGVRAEDTWPAQLQRTLAAGHKGPVTVLNGAVPGASLKQLAFAAKHEWSDKKPDALVVVVSANMISLAWTDREQPAGMPWNRFVEKEPTPSLVGRVKVGANRAIKKLCLPSFVSLNVQRGLYWVGLAQHDMDPSIRKAPWLAYGPIQQVIHGDIPGQAWECFAVELEAMRDVAREMNVPLIVAFSPTRFWISDELWDNEKCVPVERLTIDAPGRFSQLAQTLNIPCVDLIRGLQGERVRLEENPPALYIPFDFGHFDAHGHAVVARLVADQLNVR